MTKPKTHFSVEQIGSLWTTDGKDVWRLMDYKPEPMVTMVEVAVDGKTKEGYLSEFASFVPLIPAVKPPNAPKRKYTRKEQPPGEPT